MKFILCSSNVLITSTLEQTTTTIATTEPTIQLMTMTYVANTLAEITTYVELTATLATATPSM